MQKRKFISQFKKKLLLAVVMRELELGMWRDFKNDVLLAAYAPS
jgi:hypothetical protein